MTKIPDFILFDDDPVNNTLCQITIKNTIENAKIKTFTSPKKGLQYIAMEYINKPDSHAILFLDINMHGMTCWEFLEQFEHLDEKIKTKFNIYVLSASLNPIDKERAVSNKNVSDYIEKPLTGDKIRDIVSIN
jgi:response regulator RpfG family c-di-GMP phosphodiesterase